MDKKSIFLTLRVSPGDLAAMQDLARQMGVCRSEALRQAVHKAVVKTQRMEGNEQNERQRESGTFAEMLQPVG
jgi:hypothetical protein